MLIIRWFRELIGLFDSVCINRYLINNQTDVISQDIIPSSLTKKRPKMVSLSCFGALIYTYIRFTRLPKVDSPTFFVSENHVNSTICSHEPQYMVPQK